MFILDRMLVGGIRFVLDKVARAVDSELYDVDSLREQLLAAQLDLEVDKIDEAEFTALEARLLELMREARQQSAIGTGALQDVRADVSIDLGGRDAPPPT